MRRRGLRYLHVARDRWSVLVRVGLLEVEVERALSHAWRDTSHMAAAGGVHVMVTLIDPRRYDGPESGWRR